MASGWRGEQDVEAAAVERRGRQALEVVERHVGIGRDAQMVEEPRQERRHLVAQVGRLGEAAQVRERAGGIEEAQAPERREAGRAAAPPDRGSRPAGGSAARAGRSVSTASAPRPARAAGAADGLDRVFAPLARPDAHGLLHGQDEDLAVPDRARSWRRR